jgi:uncharacterized protein (TIGR03086 family)
MWAVMTEALKLLTAAAAAVTPDQRDAPTPCTEWTTTQVLQHAAGDQLAWAAALGLGNGPDDNPFDPSGKLDRPLDELVATAVAAAQSAWATVTEIDGSVPTPLPQGPLPTATAAAACALDAAVHAWDVLTAVGVPAGLSPELAAQLLPAAREIVEPLRQYGVYAAALTPEPDDEATTELLRYLGRNPDWRSRTGR